jgi:hypothetical protein
VAFAQEKSASGQGEAEDQGERTYQRRRFL